MTILAQAKHSLVYAHEVKYGENLSPEDREVFGLEESWWDEEGQCLAIAVTDPEYDWEEVGAGEFILKVGGHLSILSPDEFHSLYQPLNLNQEEE